MIHEKTELENFTRQTLSGQTEIIRQFCVSEIFFSNPDPTFQISSDQDPDPVCQIISIRILQL